MRMIFTVLALSIVAAVSLPSGSRAQWKTPWSYQGPMGPDQWGDLDPDYAACARRLGSRYLASSRFG